jgi:hypothetical protein
MECVLCKPRSAGAHKLKKLKKLKKRGFLLSLQSLEHSANPWGARHRPTRIATGHDDMA